jgi:hypothetical protein
LPIEFTRPVARTDQGTFPAFRRENVLKTGERDLFKMSFKFRHAKPPGNKTESNKGEVIRVISFVIRMAN